MDQRSSSLKVVLLFLIALLSACDQKQKVTAVVPKITKDEYMRLDAVSVPISDYISFRAQNKSATKESTAHYFSTLLILSRLAEQSRVKITEQQLREACDRIQKRDVAPLHPEVSSLFRESQKPKTYAELNTRLQALLKNFSIQKNAAF